MNPESPRARTVYVGTYTRREPHVDGTANGLHICSFDVALGRLERRSEAIGVVSPAFVAVSRDGRRIYAVNEVDAYDGRSGGAVTAFAAEGGPLRKINAQPSGGTLPCHLALSASGRWLAVANYGSGSVSVYPVASDGALGEATETRQHTGSGPNPARQQGPHAHAVYFTPDDKFALVADLGTDKIVVYRFDAGRGALVPNDPPSVSLKPGAGPRHLALHPGGRHAFCVNELDSTVSLLAFDAQRGVLRVIQSLTTLPQGFEGINHTAEIDVTADGRFVYASNRGHDSIAAFAFDEAGERIAFLGHTSTGGRVPRNFSIDPTGRFLLAANQDTHTVVTFAIDAVSGALSATGEVCHLPTPVCVCFAPDPAQP